MNGNDYLEKIYPNLTENNSPAETKATLVIIDLENANGMLSQFQDEQTYRAFDLKKLLKHIKNLGYQIVEKRAYQFKEDSSGNFKNFLKHNKIDLITAEGTDYKNADEIIINDIEKLVNDNLDSETINHVLLISGDIHFADSLKNLQNKGIGTSICSSKNSLNRKYLDMSDLTVHCLDEAKLIELSEIRKRKFNSTQNIDDTQPLKINIPAENIGEKTTSMILLIIEATGQRPVELNIY